MKIVTDTNAVAWDQQTFKGVYETYFDLICRYCFALVDDYEEARDISAKLFCDLWKNRANIRVSTNLKNYLLVSARRLCYKRNNSRQNDILDSDFMAESIATDDTPATHLVNKEARQKLQQLLSRLDPVKREIIDMKLLGLTQREIAQVLQITPKKVEYQLNAAIRQLQGESKQLQLSSGDYDLTILAGLLFLLMK
ncbi:RNA polymerase sigma factor [Chitinophaga sp. Cy-1792]|uniref:RNA polymerase sigma factor n=1 Tax=Chitinophaga sp. Cy-1792 TaxID=2608339 RepID=UPI0014207677|nr:sigma-70 family RNA polymerase sigma factor [Chitinophaga sp. Cy-1792]NIG56481.1 sigma-70 family RNA polymerase sigma factor [Chitinophaga sp. Cy-1792]